MKKIEFTKKPLLTIFNKIVMRDKHPNKPFDLMYHVGERER